MPATTTPSDPPAGLYFGYTSAPPDLTALTVKTVHPDVLFDQPAVFTVLGESHYVGLPALGFHEICSCTPLPSETMYETPLTIGVERAFRFDGERLDATTIVTGQAIETFPGPDEATLVYRFGPEAWTTIHVTDSGYETYHTYPEHGLVLVTETQLNQHTSPESSIGDSRCTPGHPQ